MKTKITFVSLWICFFLPLSFAQQVSVQVATYDQLIFEIRRVRTATEQRIEAAVEAEKVREAWETGKLIDEHILLHKERADYGEKVIIRLAGDLGTSETEIRYMLQFARTYPIHPSTDELPWGHYRELLSLNDTKQRTEVAAEALQNKWTQKQLCEEIKRRKHNTVYEPQSKLPIITPGPLYTYPIIRLHDQLKIDLGFGIYHGLPEKDAGKFKEGDIVTLEKGKLKKTEKALLFTYAATVTQVVDGDTFHALIDLGFETTVAQRVRLRRIDAPEILSAEGKQAKAYLEKILSRNQGRVLLQSHDLDQHGRPIADVFIPAKPSGYTSIDQELLDQGLAVKINE
jgi:endonuclease YncB( thermonuclease family)